MDKHTFFAMSFFVIFFPFGLAFHVLIAIGLLRHVWRSPHRFYYITGGLLYFVALLSQFYFYPTLQVAFWPITLEILRIVIPVLSVGGFFIFLGVVYVWAFLEAPNIRW